MNNTINTPKMVAVAASAQGYAHKKKNVENQDSFAYQIHEGYYKYQTKEGYYEEQPYQLLVAVVSDGAGSAKYAKSGSSLCVQYLTQHLMQLAVDTIDGKLSSDRYLPNIKHIISEHLQYFNQVEDAKQFNHTINIVVYSPTLGGKIIQIGDSPSVVVYSNQADFSLSAIFDEEKKGEYANQTVFSTHKNWEQHLRIEELPHKQPLALFLMTDGPATYFFEKEKMPLSDVPQYIQTLMNSLGQGTYVRYQLTAVQKALLNACKYANLHSLKKIADEIGAIDNIDQKWLSEFQKWLSEFLAKINIEQQKLANGTIENNVAEHIILPVVSVNKMNALIQKLGQATYIDQALLDFLEADDFCESTGDDKTVVAYFPENWLSSAPQYSPNYKQDNIEIDANLPKRDNSVENHRINQNDWPVSTNNKAATSYAEDPVLDKNTFNKNNPHEKEETPIKPQTPVVDTLPEPVEENKKKANNTIKTTQYAIDHNDDIEEEAYLPRSFGDMSINGTTVKLIILCVVCLLLLLGFMLFKGGKEEDSVGTVAQTENAEHPATQTNTKAEPETSAPTGSDRQQNSENNAKNSPEETSTDGSTSSDEVKNNKWFKETTDTANSGDNNAQYELGMCYITGENGCKQNDNQAVEWLEKAANQGHAEAQVALGDWYVKQAQGLRNKQQKQAIETAIDYYTKATKQGHAKAQLALGDWYMTQAQGLRNKQQKQAIETAIDYYTKAANQGHAEAQLALGDWYVKQAQGLKNKQQKQQAIDTAIDYYTKAAEQGGNAEAAYQLGNIYNETNNKTKACTWYQRAAELGHEKAPTIVEHDNCDKVLSPRPAVQENQIRNRPEQQTLQTNTPNNQVRTEIVPTNPQAQQGAINAAEQTPHKQWEGTLRNLMDEINASSSIGSLIE